MTLTDNTPTAQALPKVIVRKIHHIDNRRSCLRAYVEIQVGDFIFSGVKVIQYRFQRPYVTLPQNQRDGCYYPVVRCLNKELDSLIKKTVLDEWNKQKEQNSAENRVHKRVLRYSSR